MAICNGMFSVENLTHFQHLQLKRANSWHGGCCASLHPRRGAVEFDSTVTRTGTLSWTLLHVDMCPGLVFSTLCFSLSCSVFLCCDISTVIVFIRGSRWLPCCFVDLAICVCTAKEHVSDHLHALHSLLTFTRQQRISSSSRPASTPLRSARNGLRQPAITRSDSHDRVGQSPHVDRAGLPEPSSVDQ